MMNVSIVVPEGTSNHGTQNLLCIPPSWHHYITFYISNYLVHVATLIGPPGATFLETVFLSLNALFVPGSGAIAALPWLIRHPGTTRDDELRRAAKTGALCMVVKQKYIPALESLDENSAAPDTEAQKSEAEAQKGDAKAQKKGDEKEIVTVDQQEVPWFEKAFTNLNLLTFVPRGRATYGKCHLPEGYCYVQVPETVPLQPYSASSDPTSSADLKKIRLPSSYSVPKVLIGLAQALIGAMTLYKAKGDQISRYGYAAFGLSVVPYALMSLVNIITALVTPEYTCIYLVHTPDMDDAVKHGGHFGSVIATVDISAIREPIPFISSGFMLAYGVILFFLTVAPLALVGALSRFQVGRSSPSQRGWMMSWLVVGSASSVWLHGASNVNLKAFMYWGRPTTARMCGALVGVGVFILPLWVPAIGGMVTAGLMIKEYGVCTKIDL